MVCLADCVSLTHSLLLSLRYSLGLRVYVSLFVCAGAGVPVENVGMLLSH